MRILIVSSYYPPIQSGSSFYAFCLAHTLKKLGHEVGVVTVDWKGEKFLRDEKEIPIWYLPALIVPPLPFLLNMKLLGFASLRPSSFSVFDKVISEFKPDVIHQVNHIFDTALISALRGHKWKIPVICSISTQIRHTNRFIGFVMRVLDRLFIGNLIVRFWDKAICLDSEILRYLLSTYGSQISKRSVIIPYGLPLDWNPIELTNSRKRKKDGRIRIISLGHVHELRDRLDLIAAMPEVLQKYPDTELLIVGRVHLESPIDLVKTLSLENNVKFLGEIPHAEVETILRSSDMQAMWATGEYTGLGTSAIESMACGLPLITASPEDLFGEKGLENWQNVVLIERGNEHMIAQSIIRLIENEELRHQIGINGQLFVKKFLSWEPIVEKIVMIYQETTME